MIGRDLTIIGSGLKIVGEDGKGYKSISFSYPVLDAPVMADIKKHVVDAGNSLSNEEEMQGVFYSRGLVISMILAEGIKTAQEMTGKAEISAADLRAGLENLNVTEERLAELGMTGMVPPFQTTCANHTGHSGGWMLEWDGEKFVKVSDHMMAEADMITPLEVEKAAEYAAANEPWAVSETCNVTN